MKLSAPTKPVFWIATILGALGILGQLASIPFFSDNSLLVLAIGFVLLWLGNVMKGF